MKKKNDESERKVKMSRELYIVAFFFFSFFSSLTHYGHISISDDSFEIWPIGRDLAFIRAAAIEMQPCQRDHSHIRLRKLEFYQKNVSQTTN